MKESRFIELLNLYVDHQLDAAEAAELERELQRDPKRRRTYVQYCRMQKACTELFENERAVAPQSLAVAQALAEADRKIVAFPGRRAAASASWTRHRGWLGGLSAAAACAAFVVVRTVMPVSGGAVAKTDGTDNAPAVVTAAPALAAVETEMIATRADSVVALAAAAPSQTAAISFATADIVLARHRPTTNSVELDWLHRTDLAPIRKSVPGDLSFEPRSEPQTEFTLFRPAAPVESAAYQFQK